MIEKSITRNDYFKKLKIKKEKVNHRIDNLLNVK